MPAGTLVTANGNMAVVGGPEDSEAKLGAAWVYLRTGSTWAQQANLVAPVQACVLV